MHLTKIMDALERAFEVPRNAIDWRLKYLMQRHGQGAGTPGSGRRLDYSTDDLERFALMLAFLLPEVHPHPTKIVELFHGRWDTMRWAFRAVENEAEREVYLCFRPPGLFKSWAESEVHIMIGKIPCSLLVKAGCLVILPIRRLHQKIHQMSRSPSASLS